MARSLRTVAFVMLAIPACRASLQYSEDFENGAPRWQATEPKAWEVRGEPGHRYYSLFQKEPTYAPPVRSPHHLSILNEEPVSSFELEVLVRSTHPDYAHRDVCIVFGYQDPTHYYYAHLSRSADENAHAIFLVDGAPRRNIVTHRTNGVEWDDDWHRLRIVRDVESGSIRVFLDASPDPVLEAIDRTFLSGRVGLGSFDDTADFDNLNLMGSLRP